MAPAEVVSARRGLSIVIPTYGRERVLVETLEALRALEDPAEEIVVVDQTVAHETATVQFLERSEAQGWVRWLRLSKPSIPHAMNAGLAAARTGIVLFLDDDIVPDRNLVSAHRRAHEQGDAEVVTGQVLQPWEEPENVPLEEESRGAGLHRDLGFPFRGTSRAFVHSCMAGNLSVRRDFALGIGGFDERFEKVAYRFETEFARRVWAEGGKVQFEPAASIRHLRVPSGGTRTFGSHLGKGAAAHAVGDYYFAMVCGSATEALSYAIARLLGSVQTRFHLRRPWWIPVRLAGEAAGLVRAAQLYRQRSRVERKRPRPRTV